MPVDPIVESFDFPAQPGGGWPPVIGATSEELAPNPVSSAAAADTSVAADEEGVFIGLLVWGSDVF